MNTRAWEIAFTGGQSAALVIGGAVLAVVLALAFYLPKRTSLSRPAFIALCLLRAIVIVIVALFLLQPVLRLTYATARRTSVAVMVDVSGSMRVPDAADDRPRLEAALSLLETTDMLRRLDRTHDVRLFAFGTSARELENRDELNELAPDERGTALGDALRAAVQNVGRPALSDVVVFTDGVVTHGEAPADWAANVRDIAVFPVAMGGGGLFPDVGIGGVPDLPRFMVNNEAVVKVDLVHTALGGFNVPGRRLELTLREGRDVLAAKQIDFPPVDGTLQAELTFVPQQPGVMRLTLQLGTLRNELVVENNERSFNVRVTDPHIRALIVEGVVRSEYRFLRRVLESDPNVELTSVIKISGKRFLLQGIDPGIDLTRGLPVAQEDFDKFDVVILGDISREEFSASQLTDLRAFVDGRGGLLVLGGYHALGAGGYAGSPLAEVLPVTMGGTSDGHVEAPFVPVLTEAGRDHLVFRGGEEFFEGDDAPGKLDGANRVAGLKHGAEALAVHPFERAGGAPLPVVAVHRYGAGRVMVLAADTTWKWRFRMATRGLDSPYYRFWRQSLRWLSSSDEDETGTEKTARVTAWTPRLAYEAGQHAVMMVRVKDAAGQPLDGATVDVSVDYPVPVTRAGTDGTTSTEDSTTVRLDAVAGTPGEYSAAWLPPVTGLYRAAARARHRGQEIGLSRFEFASGLAVSAWASRPQYEVGQPVQLRARVRDNENQPLSDAKIAADIEFPFAVARKGVHGRDISEQRATIEFSAMADAPGEYQAHWQPPAPGLYRATVKAEADAAGKGSYLLEFVVGNSDPEFRTLQVDQTTLRTLASATDGRPYTQATAAGIPEELDARRQHERRYEEITLWNAPWFFVVLLLCATSEWILRKRRALS